MNAVFSRSLSAVLAIAALFVGTSTASASSHGKLYRVHGSGTSMVYALVENPDGTMNLDAQQEGSLGNLGLFTGTCSYLATFDLEAERTNLTGTGRLVLTSGDCLDLSINMVEFGFTYPMPYVGMMLVTGGTGGCSGAYGYLFIQGYDEEILTDSLKVDGFIWLPKAKK